MSSARSRLSVSRIPPESSIPDPHGLDDLVSRLRIEPGRRRHRGRRGGSTRLPCSRSPEPRRWVNRSRFRCRLHPGRAGRLCRRRRRLAGRRTSLFGVSVIVTFLRRVPGVSGNASRCARSGTERGSTRTCRSSCAAAALPLRRISLRMELGRPGGVVFDGGDEVAAVSGRGHLGVGRRLGRGIRSGRSRSAPRGCRRTSASPPARGTATSPCEERPGP